MKVAVLYGGASAERDVSLVTGRAVADALGERKHDVRLVETQVDGYWCEAVADADVVFIALHGGAGENGIVQGVLELQGKAYTGSGVLASALAMDKRISKLAFREAGVPTPEWRVVEMGQGPETRERGGSPSFPDDLSPEEARGAVDELGGYPVIVKPNDQGSTVGLTLVRDEGGLATAIDLAGRYSSHVMLETYVPGRELTVAVLDGEALPLVEVEPKSGLYDYESKYTKGMTVYTCPAEMEESAAAEMSEAGLRAFECLGCSGYGRADFRLDPEGGFYCLEVNTVPGMTEVSLVPMAAKAAGIDFPELCERILQTAKP